MSQIFNRIADVLDRVSSWLRGPIPVPPPIAGPAFPNYPADEYDPLQKIPIVDDDWDIGHEAPVKWVCPSDCAHDCPESGWCEPDFCAKSIRKQKESE